MVIIADDEIKILNFPMPPTTNKQFFLSRGRFIKSSEARLFDAQVLHFSHKFVFEGKSINRKLFVKCELGTYFIAVETEFVFPYDKLFTKLNLPKTIDANNRIKSCLDGLSKFIGIDDKFFFEGSYRKIGCKNLKQPYVNLTLTLKQNGLYKTTI